MHDHRRQAPSVSRRLSRPCHGSAVAPESLEARALLSAITPGTPVPHPTAEIAEARHVHAATPGHARGHSHPHHGHHHSSSHPGSSAGLQPNPELPTAVQIIKADIQALPPGQPDAPALEGALLADLVTGAQEISQSPAGSLVTALEDDFTNQVLALTSQGQTPLVVIVKTYMAIEPDLAAVLQGAGVSEALVARTEADGLSFLQAAGPEDYTNLVATIAAFAPKG